MTVKVTDRQLEILYYLQKYDLVVVTQSGFNSGRTNWRSLDNTWSTLPKELPKITHAQLGGDFYRLLKRLDKEEDPDRWAWYSTPYRIGSRGLEILALPENQKRIQAILKAKETAKNAPKEYVIIRGETSSYRSAVRYEEGSFKMSKPLPVQKYAALCEVVKRTPTRVYVNPVMDTTGKQPRYSLSNVKGTRDNNFVDLEDVTVNNATEEQFLQLVEIEQRARTEMAERWKQMWAEMAPIHNRYMSRDVQNEAMYEEEYAQVLKPKESN